MAQNTANDGAAANAAQSAPVDTTEMLIQERIAVATLRGKKPWDQVWFGLALSGGGIRSASFALGAMQGLNAAGIMHRFDYLSTVSGGGYIGSALSYFLAEHARELGNPADLKFWFPFGKKWQTGARGDRTFELLAPEIPAAGEIPSEKPAPPDVDDTLANQIVNFIRQQAHFLTPTPKLGMFALIANALRATLFSLGVYFALLVLAMVLAFGLGRPDGWLHALTGTDAATLIGWEAETNACGCALVAPAPVAACVAAPVSACAATPASACGLNGRSLIGWPCQKGTINPFVPIGALAAAIFLLLTLITSLYTYFVKTGKIADDDEPTRQFYSGFTIPMTGWLGRLLVIEIACTALAFLPWIYAWAQQHGGGGMSGAIAVLIAYLGTWREKYSAMLGRLTSSAIWASVWPYLYSALAIYGVLFLAFGAAEALHPAIAAHLWILAALIGGILFFGWVVNLNLVSQHRMYRDRLMEAMCPDLTAVRAEKWEPARIADAMQLSRLPGGRDSRIQGAAAAPYHLINTALIIPDSKKPKFSGRGADSFVFSANWCGSDATHWAATPDYMAGRMMLPTAMAISGAALNAHSGPDGKGALRGSLVSFLVTLFGAQLGFWAPNPRYLKPSAKNFQQIAPNYLRPGIRGLLGSGMDEFAGFVQLSDGGHFENLGLYELIRRKMRVIVVCDGGQDPGFAFADLGNAIERIRVDFGVGIDFGASGFNLEGVLPKARDDSSNLWATKFGLAERGFGLAWIVYPDEAESGILIYLKTTMIDGLPSDLYAYKAQNASFPDQSTLDQDFTEDQFEAYRELGYQLAKQMTDDLRKKPKEWPPEPEILGAARGYLWP